MKLTIPFFLILMLTAFSVNAQNAVPAKDSTKTGTIQITDTTKKKKEPYMHQARFGIDLAAIGSDFLYSDKKSFELQVDYKLRKSNYVVLEGGWGKNKVDYTNLKYSNSNGYIRLGIDKNVLDVLGPKDFDIFFIGVRLGVASGKRSDVSFLVPSYFGPDKEASNPGQNYFISWGEINTGIRVELLKDLFVGWNVRIKFIFNSGEFSELAPSFVPGYGKGDQATNFGANIYLSYAMRWMGK